MRRNYGRLIGNDDFVVDILGIQLSHELDHDEEPTFLVDVGRNEYPIRWAVIDIRKAFISLQTTRNSTPAVERNHPNLESYYCRCVPVSPMGTTAALILVESP